MSWADVREYLVIVAAILTCDAVHVVVARVRRRSP